VVQSVELLLDGGLDAAVRAQWQALADAGLPSQARHTGATNRPHVTLAVHSEPWPATVEAALPDAVGPLPLTLRLGGLVSFGQGGGRYVLARLVVPSAGLLALHARIAAAVDPGRAVDPDRPGALGALGALGGPDHLGVGRWTPHVTLARRLDAAAFPAALGALAAGGRAHTCGPDLEGRTLVDGVTALDGSGVAVRRWDGDARRAWVISP
jgi:2'-5' RNA ligase